MPTLYLSPFLGFAAGVATNDTLWMTCVTPPFMNRSKLGGAVMSLTNAKVS